MSMPAKTPIRLACALVCMAAPLACAQTFPAKPVRMLVGFTAGGAADVVTRMVAQKISEQVGQTVIVENRPGAGGAIATERVVTSPPDGYTLLMMTAGDTALPALRAKLPYQLERDLTPVSLVAVSPFVLVVHPSVPARNVKELVALARSRSDRLSYGSAGMGTVAHLAGELFKATANASIVQVPFKGGAESVIATVAGQIDMNFPNIMSALPFVQSGKLVVLGVTTARRVSLLPSTPTLAEAGLPGYDCAGWWAVMAPTSTPKDIVERLNVMTIRAVGAPDLKEALGRQGFEPQTSTPEQLATRIQREIAQNARLVKQAGLKAE